MLSTHGIILSLYSCICTQTPAHAHKKWPWILDLDKSFVSASLTPMGNSKETLDFSDVLLFDWYDLEEQRQLPLFTMSIVSWVL